MSLRDVAVSDFKSILDTDNEDVTFTRLSDDGTFSAKCQVIRTADRYDPQTQTRFDMPISGVVVPIGSLPDGEDIQDATHLFEFQTGSGETKTMRGRNPRKNDTLAFIEIDMEEFTTV